MTDQENERSPILFSVGLAVGLLAVVVVLNFLGREEVPVKEEQFNQLLNDGLVEEIEIVPSGLIAHLKKRVRISEDGQENYAKIIWLIRGIVVSSGEKADWEQAGIAVSYREEEGGGWRAGGGWVLIFMFLGVGGWYMWRQIQEDRTGKGSPRRRLQQLEQDFEEGKMEEEDYQRDKEAIWAEM